MQHKKTAVELIREKGFYILLFLCAVAVGVSGYLFCKKLTAPEALPDSPALAQAPDSPVLEAPLPTQAPAEPAVKVEPAPTQTETAPPETAEAAEAPARSAVRPVEGEAVQVFAMDRLIWQPTTRDWRTHAGVDLLAREGQEVRCALDGVVEAVYRDEFLGQTVTVRHEDGVVTRYANLQEEIPVQAGQEVAAGQCLGTVGTTALLEAGQPPHLHFAVYRDNVPQDPEAFLAG